MPYSKRIVLHFPQRLVDRPIMSRLVRDYDLDFNILKAFVSPEEEGHLVLEIIGKKENLSQGLKFLQELGIKTQPLSKDIKRNEKKCTHCGVCIPLCPTGALFYEPKTYRVIFDESKCIACELCIKPCPPRAMEVHF